MRRWLHLSLVLFTTICHAACTVVGGGVYNAFSPHLADISDCAVLVSADGYVINVPPGTVTDTTGSVTIPCFNGIFQGAGAGSTVITNNQTANAIQMTSTCNTAPTFQFLDMTLNWGASISTSGALISIDNCYGGCHLKAIRMKFQGPTTNTARAMRLGGQTQGVCKNCTLTDIGVIGDRYTSSESNGAAGGHLGDNAWTLGPQLGTDYHFYFEDTVFNWVNHVDQLDMVDGYAFTYDHDTFNFTPGALSTSGSCGPFGHGKGSVANGFRELVIHDSVFSANCPYRDAWLRGGTALMYNNQINGGSNSTSTPSIELNCDRCDQQSIGQPQNGYGTYDDGTQSIDGNLSGLSNDGWPAGEQVGRGGGTAPAYSAETAAFWGNCDNVADGSCTPGGAHEINPQVVESFSCTGGNICNTTRDTVNDRDYLVATSTNSGKGGTTGVGKGLSGAEPAACTPLANSSGPYYYETDTRKVYRCDTTNHWALFYTEFTYPYPGTGTSAPHSSFGIRVAQNEVNTNTTGGQQ